MKRIALVLLSIAPLGGLPGLTSAASPPAAEGHDAFLKGLRELEEQEVKSTSKARTLSPVVSRFKGWFIDVTGKARLGKLGDVEVVEGISLASEARDTSAWQFVETDKGYLVRAAGGKYKGWVIARDDSAKTRAPRALTSPSLRLSASPRVQLTTATGSSLSPNRASCWKPPPANTRDGSGTLVEAIPPTRNPDARLPLMSSWPRRWWPAPTLR